MNIKLLLLCMVCCCQVGLAKPYQEDDPQRYTIFPYYNNTTKLWGYADSSGKVLITPRFLEVRHFFYGFAKVKTKGGWLLINPKGVKMTRNFYDSIQYVKYPDCINCFKKGLADKYTIKEDKLVLESKNFSPSNIVMDMAEMGMRDPIYFPIVKLFKPDQSDQWYLARFEYNKKNGAYELAWQSTEYFNQVDEPVFKKDFTYAIVKQKDRYGIIGWNELSEYAIHPAQYDTILLTNPDKRAVFFGLKNGKYAIITAEKSLQTKKLTYYYTEPLYDNVKTFASSHIPVKQKDNWYILYGLGMYTIKLDTLIKNPTLNFIDLEVQDIKPTELNHDAYFYYQKNDLWGLGKMEYPSIISKVNACYTSVAVVHNWFDEKEYYYWKRMLLYVTMPDGKKGYVTTKGVKLFE